MKSKILMLISLCLLTIGSALGQTITVKGIVTDERGDGVIGATVRLKSDATVGTMTGLDGDFTLKAKQGEIIIVSYVGYKTQEVAAAPTLNIKLAPDTEMLDDVVVVAYGTAKKESLVGAQTNISAKKLESRPLTNATSALAGATPGIQVTTAGGQPGDGSAIRIRGFGSINASSAPLIVVDGSVYHGSIADIATTDIANISLLKDASSTALYGSSAGNGVILITTKSGKSGRDGKPITTVNISQGFSRRGAERYETVNDPMQYIPLLWSQWYNENIYANGDSPEQAALWANYSVNRDIRGDYYNPFTGIKTGIAIDGKTYVASTTQDQNKWYAPLYVTKEGQINPEITGLKWGDDLNWEDYLFRTGHRQDYNVSTTYNNDVIKSFLSLGYIKEDGYRVFSNFERFNGRASLTYNATDWLEIGTNLSMSKTSSDYPAISGDYYNANSFNFISKIAPIYPVHVHNPETGEYILDDQGKKIFDYNPQRPFSGKFNPIMQAEIDPANKVRDMISNRSFFTIKFMPWLSFTANMAYDTSRTRFKRRRNNIMGDQPDGTLSIEDNRYQTLLFNQLLNFNKSFGEHNLEALLGHESYELTSTYSYLAKKGMGLLGYDEMSNLSEVTDAESNTTPYRKEGYLGRVNYSYASKYNVSATGRYDGTSRLHRDNRWGFFWSLGAGWNMHMEDFMSDAKFVDALKLRLSYGQTGNDALSSYFAYATQYGLGFFNGKAGGVNITSFGNPDLVWESQDSFDAAIEFSLFSNKLRGTVEYFNKQSTNLIFPFPLQPSTGTTSIDKNIGKVRNYGLELDLSYTILNQNDFYWDVTANATFLKNKIVKLPEENREEGMEVKGLKKYVEGGSIYDFYTNEWIGVDPEDGLAMYRIDEKLYPEQADPKSKYFAGVKKEGEAATWTKDGRFAKKHFAGSAIPTVYGGFGTSFGWKGIDLAINFAYQLGGKTYDGAYQDLMGRKLNAGYAFHKDMLNAWKEKGQVTDVPRLDAGDDGKYDNMTSDRFLISSNALMLKSIVLGYNMPDKWFETIGVRGVRLSVSGENLFLWSARKGLNPMMNYGGVTGASSYDYAKLMTATLTLTF